MRKAQVEDITSYFDDGLVGVTDSGPLRDSVRSVKLKRNKKGDLILTTISEGWLKEDRPGFPAGTLRQSTEAIQFRHLAGWRGAARGVVPQGVRSYTPAGKEKPETVEQSLVHSIELDFASERQSVYLIEWIDNLHENALWPDSLDYSSVEKTTEIVGSPEHGISILGAGEEKSVGRAAMSLVLGGVELFVTTVHGQGRKSRRGRIVYRSCPSQEFRNKVRNCLSLTFGLPIVYYGYTEFCADLLPTKAIFVCAFSIGGAVFRLHEQPPFRIWDSRFESRQMLDGRAVETITNNLLEKYDVLMFADLSWAYWHAMCAPVHMAAAHFGAVIEQFQRTSPEIIQASRRGLLKDNIWKASKAKLRAALDETEIPEVPKPILKSKADRDCTR